VLAFFKSILVGTIKRIVALALAVAIIIAGLEAWWWFRLPPVLRGLASGIAIHGSSGVEEEFRNRVRSRFPTGALEADLVRDLTSEGFESIHLPNGKQYLMFDGDGDILCRRSWSVSWKSNAAGVLEEVETYLRHSCL
jgi:hypothetical protein